MNTLPKEITLESIKPISNHVLLKINIHNDRVSFKNGFDLFLDTSYSARHTSVNCIVVKAPSKLTFSHELMHDVSMPHQTKVEIKEGDIVIVNWLAVHNAFSDNQIKRFEIDGETYFFVSYDNLIVAKREWTKTDIDLYTKVNGAMDNEDYLLSMNVIKEGDKVFSIIPLNGIVLVEPLPEDIQTKLILPESVKKKRLMTMSKVVFAGSCNGEYWRNSQLGDRYYQREEYWGKVNGTDLPLSNGDYVITESDVNILAEGGQNKTIWGEREFWQVERKCIKASVPEITKLLSEVGIFGEVKVKK